MASTLLHAHAGLARAVTDDGYLVFHTDSADLHRLNATAALILELAQGCSSSAIIEELKPYLGPEAEQCRDWINVALDAGLLTDAPMAVRSASHFIDSARQLRQEGKILAAFVCQQEAVMRTPEDPAAWLALGELAHILGRRLEARDAYTMHLQLHPDNAEAAHILRALQDMAPPPRAPDACILQLYERFAAFYEHNMRDELDYQAPEQIGAALLRHCIPDSTRRVLELGCGTGLAADHLRPFAVSLIGVDLSPHMLARAAGLELYDALYEAELTQFLGDTEDEFDLIVACDTFIYFGDLGQVLLPAAARLLPQGLLVFTVEAGADVPFRLTDSGRYAHSPEHVKEAAARAGLVLIELREVFLRREYGEDVYGLLCVLQADSGA
jgi:predicted TPR repeat methyltransferase